LIVHPGQFVILQARLQRKCEVMFFLRSFGPVIWSPYLIKDIKLIEVVQKRFTKRLPNLNRVTYEVRLKILGLQSLELTRLQKRSDYCL
jgi:hypothetical protein